jgi:glycerol-3-phosphate acyltransferase PlsY
MNPILISLLAAVIGYLLGSISFARIVARVFAPDKEITGMRLPVANSDEVMEVSAVSGTTISMELGAKYGVLTALLDIAKVAIPALIFRLRYPETPYFLLLAAAGLVGHNWPLYHRFKGGRGLSPSYGGLLVCDWLGTLIMANVGMFLGMMVLKNIGVAYILGFVLMIPWLWFRTRNWAYVAYAIFVTVIFIIAMIPEIKKIRDLRRRGLSGDFEEAMNATPMLRGMQKIRRRLGLSKE